MNACPHRSPVLYLLWDPQNSTFHAGELLGLVYGTVQYFL